MISIDRLKEMALEDIENNPEKHLEEYVEILQQLDQLKAENEQLKKAEEYDSRYNDMQAEIDCGNAIIEKYEKCLTEIREIAKYELNNLTESAINGGRYVEILQKISEVENDR